MDKEGDMSSAPPPIPQETPTYTVNMVPPTVQYQYRGWSTVHLPLPLPYTEQTFIGQDGIPVIVKTVLTDTPAYMICPSCNVPGVTTIEYQVGCLTLMLCCLLFVCGFILGCFLIPCCIKRCKDVVHYCPNCNFLIHKHNRM